VKKAERLGLETDFNEAIIWTGLGSIDEGARRAREWARINGGKTLGMTPGGKYLESLDLEGMLGKEGAREIWRIVSKKFVVKARGQLQCLTGQVSPRTIFHTEELFEALDNPNIIGIDYLPLKPRIGIR